MMEYDFMSIIMYPELKNRRSFVHDCWQIAQDSDDYELMLEIIHDPYYYLDGEDILNLLKSKS